MSRVVAVGTAGAGVAARRETILQVLDDSGRVEVGELAQRLGVAEETVRRDLRALEQAGCLRRAHGGAIANDVGAEHPYPDADDVHDDALQTAHSLAQTVAGCIADGDAVYLDGGAVGEALAGMLRGVRIVTASVPVALTAALAADPPEVHLLGGRIGDDGRASGQWTRELAARLRLDVAVLGADGLGAGGQLLAATADGAALAGAVVGAAQRVVLVGTPELLGDGGRGVVAYAPLSAVDRVVLGASAGPVLTSLLADAGVELTTAATGADSERRTTAKGVVTA